MAHSKSPLHFLLPNKRWLLTSVDFNQWWKALYHIDLYLESRGFSLVDDHTYFLFNSSPENYLSGKQKKIFVGRSFIGQKISGDFIHSVLSKKTSFLLHSMDWIAQEVYLWELPNPFDLNPKEPIKSDHGHGLRFDDVISIVEQVMASSFRHPMRRPKRDEDKILNQNEIEFIIRLRRDLNHNDLKQSVELENQLRIKMELFISKGREM